MGWLRRKKSQPRETESPIPEAATYVVTPYSDAVRELANATVADQRATPDASREPGRTDTSLEAGKAPGWCLNQFHASASKAIS